MKFALPLREEAFWPRAAIGGRDGPTLARDLLAMSDEEFRISFKGAPMKRAKLRGLKRNAAIVLDNVRHRTSGTVAGPASGTPGDDPTA